MNGDKRRLPRYAVRLPVSMPQGHGMTVNVSGSGVAFESDAAIAPGSALEFELSLEAQPFVARCRGIVVRVEPRATTTFVAVRIDRIELGTKKPAPVVHEH